MSLLLREMTLDTKVQGVNCTASVKVNSSNGLGVDLVDKTNPNLYGFKIDLPNLYYHNATELYKRFNSVLVGETDTEYIVVRNNSLSMFSTPKDNFAINREIEEISIPIDTNDYFIYLEDVGEEYTINIEIGNSYDYKNIGGQRKFTFNTKFPKSSKALGALKVMQNFDYGEFMSPIYCAVKEEDIGMKIDTTLDKEPIYICDGTKDKLILTEDMIVRGNTNFTNTEVTINDKRIITEDNLEGIV